MIRADGSLSLGPRVVLLALVAAVAVYALHSPLTLLFDLSYSAVGALLAIRRPRNPVGWLSIGISLAFVGTMTPDVDVAAVQAGTAGLRDQVLVWLGPWTGALAWLLFASLAMVFPTGRLPSGTRSRPVARAALAIGAAAVAVSIVATPRTTVYDSAHPNGVEVPVPFSILGDSPEAGIVVGVAFGLLLGVIGVGIGVLLLRYRAADMETRAQIRWVLAATVFVVVGILTGLVLTLVFGGVGGAEWVPAVIAYPTIPISIAVAILRYRLYEIDRIVNRAIVYGSVTAMLAGLLAAASALSQRMLEQLTGGSSEFAIVGITLLVATLYTPLRKRVEAIVDRYFKYEQRLFGAYREELVRLAALIDPVRAGARLAAETLAETRSQGVAIADEAGAVIASAGTWPSEISARVPVTTRRGPVAAVLIGPRLDGRPHGPATINAVANIAALADLVAVGDPPAPVSRSG